MSTTTINFNSTRAAISTGERLLVGAGPTVMALVVLFGTSIGFTGFTVAAAWVSLATIWNLSGLSINGLVILGGVIRQTGVDTDNPFSSEHYDAVVQAAGADSAEQRDTHWAITGLVVGIATVAVATAAFLLV